MYEQLKLKLIVVKTKVQVCSGSYFCVCVHLNYMRIRQFVMSLTLHLF